MVYIVALLLLGLQFNSCFPAVRETEPGRRGETSCFVLAAWLLKALKYSLSHLLASSTLYTLPSPQVLSNLSPGWWWGGETGRCVVPQHRMCFHVCVSAVVHVSQRVFCLNPLSPKSYEPPCV